MEKYLIGTLPRQTDFFGFGWQFCLTDSTERPDFDKIDCKNVQLPHDWSIEYPVEENAPSRGSGGYFRTGIGWYRKLFSVDRINEGNISLAFDGVYMNCHVLLNGEHIGSHVFGYTPFDIDITGKLIEGENELLVCVDNSHQPGSRWYSGSGITRNVYIRRTGAMHVAPYGICIRSTPCADKAAVNIEAEINGVPFGAKAYAQFKIISPNADEVYCGKTDIPVQANTFVTHSLELSSPIIWDMNDPQLYTLETTLYCGGCVSDIYKERFGIRSIAFDADKGFFLNDRHVKLKGVCLHHDAGLFGAAVPREALFRRLSVMKDMGANAVRCSHNPPDPALLELTDEMGLLVLDEAFDEWHYSKLQEAGANTHQSRGYSEWYDANHVTDITAMLKRDRNHPSIIMWSVGNEVGEQVSPDGYLVAKELVGICHSMDPTRPVTQANDQVKAEPVSAYEDFLSELDIVGVNYTDRWRTRTETFYDEEKREHPEWILFGSEVSAAGSERGDYRDIAPDERRWRGPYNALTLKPERLWKFTKVHDYVLGDFIWTGIDYLGETFWPSKGNSAGACDTCCFPKDGFYFYKSIWRDDVPVLHICPGPNVFDDGVHSVMCYTNCFTVELLVDGKSYGVKAYEYPTQGMTQIWAHFDRPIAPVTTNDLHLCWDVPFPVQNITAIGRDADGNEIARHELVRTGAPARIVLEADTKEIDADGLSVAHITMRLVDTNGSTVYDDDRQLTVTVNGGTLVGLDNGNPKSHELFIDTKRFTFGGLALGAVRSLRSTGEIKVAVTSPDIEGAELTIIAK